MAEDDNVQKLTIVEHLDELRWRIVVCAVAVAITSAFAAFFVQQIFDILKAPAPQNLQLIYTQMTEMLMTYFKVILLTGVGLALPVIVYQIVRFVAPGLTGQEKRYLYALIPGISIAFLSGVIFAYYLVLPFTVRYLVTFSSVATPLISVGNYFSFVSMFLFWVGLSFEMPIIVFFLAKIRVVNAKKLASYRKYAAVGIFVLSAIITPTVDPFGQMIVAVPLLLLYEVGILLARVA
ncbi:MAG: twin-arginine translocase subunit TatC [Chloroflexi bacterium]|nr:twin-arginine translocase subunit TatC [Chloroflexota bacterium]